MTTTLPKTAEPVDLGAVAALRFAVTRLARQLRQEALADGGLTPSKLNALASINRLGPISLGDLAVVERVSAATVSRTVDALAAAGFVERSSDPTDGRVVFVTMTVDGREGARRQSTAERRGARATRVAPRCARSGAIGRGDPGAPASPRRRAVVARAVDYDDAPGVPCPVSLGQPLHGISAGGSAGASN